MKINIGKKDGGYYTTLKNNYNGEEMKCYMPVNIPKDMDIEYGVYDVECFLSCYKTKSGEIKPKIVVKNFKSDEKTNSQIVAEAMNDDSVYEEFGNNITVDDDFLE